MIYKRIEIYTWWKCNHKCIFCNEYPNIIKWWNTDIEFHDILKKLIKFKKLWYNHVTFLWWEPFIHKVLNKALISAKKLNYTTLVTTNANILQYESGALENLKYIDELIISIHSINQINQKKISWSNSFIDFKKVFKNIRANWNGKMLKANIVANKLNISELNEILEFLYDEKIMEISITYPDFNIKTYWEEYTKKYITPRYSEVIERVMPFLMKHMNDDMNLKLAEFPICVIKEKGLYKMSDDYCYWNRLKVSITWELQDRSEISPRRRNMIGECDNCKYKDICKWVAINYDKFYWTKEFVWL